MNKKISTIKDSYVIGAVINKAKRSSFDKRIFLLLTLTSETGIKPSKLIELKKTDLFEWKLNEIRYDEDRPFKVTKKCIDAIQLYRKTGKPFKRMVLSRKVFTGKKLSKQKPAHLVNTFIPKLKEYLMNVLKDFNREDEFELEKLSFMSFRNYYFYKLHMRGVSVQQIANMLKKSRADMLGILEVEERTYIDYL